MIVEGQSGAGKTTLIAKIAENINFWKPNTLVISRYKILFLCSLKLFGSKNLSFYHRKVFLWFLQNKII